MCILGGLDYSQMNTLVDSNILRGERNLWDIRNGRYLVMEKVTLSGSFQTQPRPEEERDAENTKLSVTRSFFELKTQDFAGKFTWTIRTKYKHKRVKSTHISAIF